MSYEPAADADALRALAQNLGLAEAAEAIVSWASPALRLTETDAASASYLGPPAAGPADFVWPEFQGAPLTALACLDLAAMPALHEATDLPPRGALLFFADLRQQGELTDSQGLPHNGGSCALVATRGPVAPDPTSAPAELRHLLTVPHPEIALELGLTEELYDAYEMLWHVQAGMLRTPPWQTLSYSMGHPHWVQDPGDPELLLLLQIDVTLSGTGSRRRLFFVGDPADIMGTFEVVVQW